MRCSGVGGVGVQTGRLTQTGALVRQQLEALAAAALVAADGVPAEVVTSTIVELTLINV